MKIESQTSLLIIDDIPSLKDLPYGAVAKVNGKTIMRLKPTQFLLNSTLVGDVLNRGDCFVCNLEAGTLYILPGTTPIVTQNATLLIRE
jgi:hypothetical protein